MCIHLTILAKKSSSSTIVYRWISEFSIPCNCDSLPNRLCSIEMSGSDCIHISQKPPRSKLLDKAVGETVDAVVESVLYDYVQFRLEVRKAILGVCVLSYMLSYSRPSTVRSSCRPMQGTQDQNILPHKCCDCTRIGKTCLSNWRTQFTNYLYHRIVFASCDPATQPPSVFERGIFNPTVTCPLENDVAFDPSHIRDFTSTIRQTIDPSLLSHKFQVFPFASRMSWLVPTITIVGAG